MPLAPDLYEFAVCNNRCEIEHLQALLFPVGFAFLWRVVWLFRKDHVEQLFLLLRRGPVFGEFNFLGLERRRLINLLHEF